jgi:hypothetical protein
MLQNLRFIGGAGILAVCACCTVDRTWAQAPDDAPRVFLRDGAHLAAARQRVRDGEAAVAEAVNELVALADRALAAGPFSVVDKDVIPPSGDKHDYMSQAPYWWPNPDTADGLPYVRRDGERNPEIHDLRNRADLGEMIDAVETLSLAWYVTGDERYANRAALLLRTWFLDDATRMNPHLRYGQAIPGINDGRGIGLIETRGLARVVDALGLLASPEVWTAADQRAIDAWFDAYLTWMRESEHGRDEADEPNNHGTFYDVQVASYSLLLGKRDVARQLLSTVGERRIATQVEPDGRQPLELARTKAWSYSVGNLAGLMALARLGEHVDVDLWSIETADGRSIRRAIDFLAPYGVGKEPWPYPQINGWSAELFYPLLRLAAVKYPTGPYRELTAEIPEASPISELVGLSPIEPVNELHRR